MQTERKPKTLLLEKREGERDLLCYLPPILSLSPSRRESALREKLKPKSLPSAVGSLPRNRTCTSLVLPPIHTHSSALSRR